MPRLGLLLLVLLLVGCSRPAADTAADVEVSVRVSPSPARVGENVLMLELKAAGKPVSASTLEVEATMSHAGMTPVLVHPAEAGPGQYRARLDLTMAGDWLILVRGQLSDGRKLQRQFPLQGVQGSH